MIQSEEIIRYLGNCKPYPQSEEGMENDKKIDSKEKKLRKIGLTLFVPAVFLELLLKYYHYPLSVSLLVQLLAMISVFVLTASVLVWPAYLLRGLKSWNANITEYEVRVETYMKSLTDPLMGYTSEELRYVDARLSERYEDLNVRLAILFGGGILKTGLLALVLASFEWLGKILDQANKIGFAFKLWPVVVIGLFVFLFSVVVPVSVKIMALRYPFQRRVIRVALELKEIIKADDERVQLSAIDLTCSYRSELELPDNGPDKGPQEVRRT
jgi:hypothetical protein